jgi:hypothetical protein
MSPHTSDVNVLGQRVPPQPTIAFEPRMHHQAAQQRK